MPNKKELLDFYNASISEPTKEFSVAMYSDLEQRLFGSHGIPADVDLFIDDHKKDPNGADKFVKYMTVQRPKGQYWMKREKAYKSGKEMDDFLKTRRGESLGQNKKSKLIEFAITKIVRRILKEKKMI